MQPINPSNDAVKAKTRANRLVALEHKAAVQKHGILKGGMVRWERIFLEECNEVMDEMRSHDLHPSEETRIRLLHELAQVVQLSKNMMTMLILRNEATNGKEKR